MAKKIRIKSSCINSSGIKWSEIKWSGVALSVFLGAMPFKAYSFDIAPDGIFVTGGKYIPNKADLTNARIALRWDWNRDFISHPNWKLDGYFDLGYSQWKSHLSAKDKPSPNGAKKAWQVGFAPVFRLSYQSESAIAPFLDFGVGVSYQSKKNIEKKLKSPINMGGHTQFETRAMVGIQFGAQKNYEVAYGWFHYSNAGLHPQNEGLDFQMLSLGMKW